MRALHHSLRNGSINGSLDNGLLDDIHGRLRGAFSGDFRGWFRVWRRNWLGDRLRSTMRSSFRDMLHNGLHNWRRGDIRDSVHGHLCNSVHGGVHGGLRGGFRGALHWWLVHERRGACRAVKLSARRQALPISNLGTLVHTSAENAQKAAWRYAGTERGADTSKSRSCVTDSRRHAVMQACAALEKEAPPLTYYEICAGAGAAKGRGPRMASMAW